MVDRNFYSSNICSIEKIATFIECISTSEQYNKKLLTGINYIDDATSNDLIFLLNSSDINKLPQFGIRA